MIYLYVIFLLFLPLIHAQSELDTCEQHIALHPNDYRAIYNAGVHAFKQNNIQRAREHFNCLKEMTNAHLWDARSGEHIFYNAGNTEVKLKDYAAAVKSFEKVLEYNPTHEIARKKLEYAKKMLEQKPEQQQNQQNQPDENNKNQEQQQSQNRNDQQEQQEKDSDQGSDEQSQKSKPDQSEQDGETENKNNQSPASDSKDQQEKEAGNNTKDKQKPQSNNKSQEQGVDKQEPLKNEQEQKPAQPDLTQEEEKILAMVQALDEKMHDALDKKKMKKAQGVVRDHHNW